MAIGDILRNENFIAYSALIINANEPRIFKSVFKKNTAFRVEWGNGATVRIVFYDNSGNSYDTGFISTGSLEYALSFNPTNFQITSNITNTLIYFYEIASPFPEITYSGTLTTITTSGTYTASSGYAQVILVSGGQGGGCGTTSNPQRTGMGGNSGVIVNYPYLYIPSSSFTVTIGAGGMGIPSASQSQFLLGFNGGATVFINSLYTASGQTIGTGASFIGGPGAGLNATTSSFSYAIQPSQLSSSATSGGGGSGAWGNPFSPAPVLSGGLGAGNGIGRGGNGGGFGGSFNQNGANATGYGAGGGGGVYNDATAQGVGGGNGSPGVVYIINISGLD